ncbi:MAG: hypothetical protein IJK28_02865 [Clostridia bacterium]|nr:hypothetical protein [Clostridia bacterium]MBQ6173540.1 hypothetical protein [Clostridia bacterium]
MKKIIPIIMLIALLAASAVAFADGNTQGGPPAGMPPQEQTGGPGGEMPSGAPGMPGGQAPAMIDFDEMVTKGVISQETCDKIKAYMESHKPADLPGGQAPDMNGGQPGGEAPGMNGEKPADPPQGQAPVMGGLLDDLLKDGVITQEEYDALTAAIA